MFSGWKARTLLGLLLAATTIALYIPAITNPFAVLDDTEYVTTNTHIRGLGWENIKWAFTATAASNWHPLTWLSHAVDYRLFALNPAGHHFDSVLIHAINVVLIFLGLTWITRRMGASLLVAALFAVHPINVESVAWIAERKNVLSTLFFLLAIGAYAWYAQKPNWRRYLLMAAAFAASLLAKPMTVTFPFVLLLLDYWPLERMRFGTESRAANSFGAQPAKLVTLLLEKLPLLALSAASSWMTMKAQHAAVQTFEEFSFANRLANAVVAYGLYLWKMVWPAELALYPHPLVTLPAWQWLLSGAVLAGITALVIVFRKKRYLPVGWFWFLGTLIPVIGLVQVGEYAMADRYAYIPLIGIFVMIVWGLADLARAKHVSAAWCVIPAVCVLAALSGATVHQIGYWESNFDLASHTLEVAETSFAHNAVGMALMNPDAEMSKQDLANFPSAAMRIDEARRHFERALELRQTLEAQSSPADMARTLNNLGNLEHLQNQLDQARQHNSAALVIYRRLAQQNPDEYLPYLVATLNNLGSIARAQNHLDEARTYYEESFKAERQLVQQNPDKYLPNLALMLNEYGLLDATQNRLDAARADYAEALSIDRKLAAQSPAVYLPQLATTLTNSALFDVYQRRLDDAQQHYEEALKIDRQLVEQNSNVYLPDLTMTLSNLARVEQMTGQLDQSRAHYEEAYNLLQKLAQGNNSYANQLAQVEASLEELEKMSAGGPSAMGKSR